MPSPSADLCRERAAIAEREAAAATLDNVRERHIRARETWLEMAERADRVAAQRERIEAEKAAHAEPHGG